MTREQNIKAILETNFSGFKEEVIDIAVKKIIEMESCGDAISRQAAIDACNQSINLLEAVDRISELPPVEPKQGKWILTADKEHGKCSNCGHKEDLVDGHSSYGWCSNCGAKMCGGDTGVNDK